MVSQKRRRFEIKRKQMRLTKRRKFSVTKRAMEKEIHTIYNQVYNYWLQCSKSNKPLLAADVSSLKSIILKAHKIADTYQALALTNEPLYSAAENYRIRHEIPNRMKFILSELSTIKKGGWISDKDYSEIRSSIIWKSNRVNG